MSAFVIAHSTVKNPELFQIYAKGVGPTLEPFGGEVLIKGKVVDVLAGAHAHKTVGVLRFPDPESARGWYGSAAYEDLIETRDQAADMTLIFYEEPVA